LDGDRLVLSSSLQQLSAPALPAQSLYEYDPAGRATKVTTKNTVGGDIVTMSTYDQRGITTSVTDARNVVAETLTDESGRPFEVRLPTVNVEENGAGAVAQRPTTQIGYNTFGNTTNGRDARGNVTSMVYDRLGRKTRIDHPNAGQGLNNVKESFTYDPSGNLLSQTDKRGNVTAYEYDTRNQVARTTLPVLVGGNAGSGIQTVLYDDAGRPVGTMDQSGASGTVTYNNMGQAILAQQLVRAAGAQLAIPTVVRMAYDVDGFMIKRVTGSAANAKTELFTPSPQGQLAESVDPNTGSTRIVRNQLGQPRSVQQNGARRVDTTYDQAGRALGSQLFGDDGQLVSGSSQTLDAVGNTVTLTSARNATTTYTYDALSRVTQIVSPAGSQGYGYDAVGNMTRSTDGRNNSTVMSFNAWNLPIATIEPSTVQDSSPGQRTFTTAYDRGGLPVQSVEPGGVQMARTFDAWNQLTAENSTQPALQGPGVQKQFGYDSSGRLARVSSPSGDSTYTYDDRGLLVAAAGVGGTASMVYDERGLPVSRTDGSGTAAFGWQPARDQLASVTDSAGGTRSYAWNSFGQLSAESYGTALRSYGYDPAGRLSADLLKDAGGVVLAGFGYSYDVSGNVSSKTVNLPGNSQSGVHAYEYDLAERLTKWTVNGTATPYQYDAAGNRTQAGNGLYTYDARNRLQTGPGETYTYSSRGALRQSTKNGVATTFTVDAAGRTAQSSVTGQAPVNFVYDGLDRVLNRNGAAFTYTGTGMDPTTDGTTSFSRGPDGTPLWLTKAGATVAAGLDRHGDLTFTLNANLTVGSTSVYDPFGAPTVKTGPGAAIGFQADWTEPSTGNVWMGARWYTPGNASFTTRDTYAGNPATPVSLNRYTYGSNNPIRYMDPTGHYSVEDMGSNLDFSYLAGMGSGGSEPAQNLTNAELYAQYLSTGYIPNDSPIDTTTRFATTSDGSVQVSNPSSGVSGVLLASGASYTSDTGYSSPNPPPLVIGGKTYNPEDSFSYQAGGGVEVNCTAAATAAGYGRTCTSSNIDGSISVTSVSGLIGLDAQGEIFGTGGPEGMSGRGVKNGNTGPIDRGNCGQGTQNVACAAIAFATGQLTIDGVSRYFDSPVRMDHDGTGCANTGLPGCPNLPSTPRPIENVCDSDLKANYPYCFTPPLTQGFDFFNIFEVIVKVGIPMLLAWGVGSLVCPTVAAARCAHPLLSALASAVTESSASAAINGTTGKGFALGTAGSFLAAYPVGVGGSFFQEALGTVIADQMEKILRMNQGVTAQQIRALKPKSVQQPGLPSCQPRPQGSLAWPPAIKC
jgi:RHS repeat-associated protein